MNDDINHIRSWKRSLILLFVIPVLLLGSIYIYYGEVFDIILAQQRITWDIFQLKTQLSIIQNDITTGAPNSLPRVVSLIGRYSIESIYFLYVGWLLIFAISTYKQLSLRQGSKSMFLIELTIILVIFILFISPGLGLWVSIVGYLMIFAVFMMLLVYWLYELKNKQ